MQRPRRACLVALCRLLLLLLHPLIPKPSCCSTTHSRFTPQHPGANVILTTKGIDDTALKYFVEAGAIAARRVPKDDLR